ncbi:hypothetical protein CsSME_00047508 [Camellia sinensis var. sinensis]
MEFIRKGPWTEEEDSKLINYITIYGEGPWNSVAQCAGIIPIKVVELLTSRCQTRKPHPSRTVSHSPPPLALGKSVVEDSSAVTRKDRQ